MLEETLTSDVPGKRVVRAVAILGDSVGVGIGDPVADGWRGYGPLLAEAIGKTRLVNLATNGARVGGVRTRQLPDAVRARPDAIVLQAGINDTLRSDFDHARLHDDLDHIVGTLTAIGAIVVLVRYHDHGRVFRVVPGPLSRVLAARIGVLNTILDTVAMRHEASVVDLEQLPGIYHAAAWSVDRLHPSELGHRMLARAVARQLAESGAAVDGEVSLECRDGVAPSRVEHLAWLLFKGVPWLFSRGGDLVPYALATMLRDVRIRANRRGVGQRTS